MQHLMLSRDFTPENHRLPISEHLLGLVISQLSQQCGLALVLVEILLYDTQIMRAEQAKRYF